MTSVHPQLVRMIFLIRMSFLSIRQLVRISFSIHQIARMTLVIFQPISFVRIVLGICLVSCPQLHSSFVP